MSKKVVGAKADFLDRHERCPTFSKRAFSGGFFCELRKLVGLMLGLQRADQLIELAVHDPVDLVQREIDAVVGDASLLKVISADAL